MASSPVIILGMNRSGTSYLSSVVASWGVNVGDKLLDPMHTNPHGFFEDEDFLNFHEAVLSAKQQTCFPSDNCIVPNAPTIELNAIERMAMEALIERKQTDGLWGWKDPRTCMFADIWLDRFPDAKLIVIYRHPLEVYSSILRRHHEMAFLDDMAVIKAWKMANEKILQTWKTHKGPKVMLGASAEVLGNKSTLVGLLAPVLGESFDETKIPVFHSNEFGSMQMSAGFKELFDAVFPEFAKVFNDLQDLSQAKINFLPGQDDEAWRAFPLLASNVEGDYRAPLLSAMSIVLSPNLAKRRHECSQKVLGHYQEMLNVEVRNKRFSFMANSFLKKISSAKG